MEEGVTSEIRDQVRAMAPVDIVIGIPTHNHARTISHILQTVREGLRRFWPARSALIIDSDAGSSDETLAAAARSFTGPPPLLTLQHPLYPVHHQTTPYHGVPGKGSAFRTLFHIADMGQARSLVILEASHISLSPEWMQRLTQPILENEFDYVSPCYERHKFEGGVTSGIVYPVTRALYGRRVRQPLGGDIAVSGRLAKYFLNCDIWATDLARYGVDLWLTTSAVAANFRVCQTPLGALLHESDPPGLNLSDTLVQIVGSLFDLMEIYDSAWRNVLGSLPVPLLGASTKVGVEPVDVSRETLLTAFRQGGQDLLSLYAEWLSKEQLEALQRCISSPEDRFIFPDELWVGLIYDFALAFHRRLISREHLLKSLTPLYLGWVTSYMIQVQDKSEPHAEGRIEKLCLVYEQLKPYLLNQWALKTREKRSSS